MTIKEVEQLLEVPRATIRFYEKENLIKPVRESNGYRDYSEYDVGRLKQIILLRKIGFSVTDIEDVLDEARTLDEVLEENLVNFMSGVTIVAAIILAESIIRIPLHFFGNRRKDKE